MSGALSRAEILAVAAAVYLLTFALPILDTSLSGGWRAVCRAVSDAVWVLFIADFLVRGVTFTRLWILWLFPGLALVVADPLVGGVTFLPGLLIIRLAAVRRG